MEYAVAGRAASPSLERLVSELAGALDRAGFARLADAAAADLVVNLFEPDAPRPFRRRSRGTFVAALHERSEPPEDVLLETYPLLVRALANVGLCYVPPGEVWFTTMERGAYAVHGQTPAELAARVVERLEPLARARLVIDNEFRADLEPELWPGDEATDEIRRAGVRLGKHGLLPAPFRGAAGRARPPAREAAVWDRRALLRQPVAPEGRAPVLDEREWRRQDAARRAGA